MYQTNEKNLEELEYNDLLTVSDIYTGKTDARNEVLYDTYDKFSKCFVMPPNFDIDRLINAEKCFIRGYKGTGKTALLYYIENEIKKVNKDSIVSFIYFKEFDIANKNKFEDMAKKINSLNNKTVINNCNETTISISNDLVLKYDGYIYIWKWFILEKILKDNKDSNYSLFIKDDNYSNFVKCMQNVQYEKLTKGKFKIPSKYIIPVEAEMNESSTKLKTNIVIDFSKKENIESFVVFKNIINAAFMFLSKMSRTNVPYYIMFDELEAFYSQEEIFTRDLCLIRDLIITI